MAWWRGCVGLILLLLIGAPLLASFTDLFSADVWSTWEESPRLLLALFIPLPLLVAGWEGVKWEALIDVPITGLPAVVLLHVLAGLPWITLLVGLGMSQLERQPEEDALTLASPLRVLMRVTLSRAGDAIAAAALWLAVQTAGEVAITDLFQVRTYAEEVYTQLVRPEGPAGAEVDVLVGRAVAVSLPSVVLTALGVMALLRWGRNRLPPATVVSRPLLFRLGPWRGPIAITTTLFVVGLVAVPVLSLVAKTGNAGSPPQFRIETAAERFQATLRTGTPLATAVLVAGWVGSQTALLALAACWLGRESRWFRWLLVGLAVLAWSLPGPLVGLGMQKTIAGLRSLTDSEVVERALYRGPSWLPVVWVQTVRLFPYALGLLWPVVRLMPRSLVESARLDGASPGREFLRVVLPLSGRAWLVSSAVLAALALGELSASKLVSTPRADPFAQLLFEQLHTGVNGDIAGRSLVLLAAVTVLAGLVAGLRRGRGTYNNTERPSPGNPHRRVEA